MLLALVVRLLTTHPLSRRSIAPTSNIETYYNIWALIVFLPHIKQNLFFTLLMPFVFCHLRPPSSSQVWRSFSRYYLSNVPNDSHVGRSSWSIVTKYYFIWVHWSGSWANIAHSTAVVIFASCSALDAEHAEQPQGGASASRITLSNILNSWIRDLRVLFDYS